MNTRYQHNKADSYDALPYSYTCLLQFPPKELDSSPQLRLWAFFFAAFALFPLHVPSAWGLVVGVATIDIKLPGCRGKAISAGGMAGFISTALFLCIAK
ncbi:hypothetical protein [Herbaspirillum sp. SJZ099]|uniref:hypothetical protein n=1 Tax=Herbaspirillum sp. SJZ099 TaxID=2572916 RepID=UPI0011A09163|nr:hypothetical protein [Herbaspirillum sp. SJZ099]